MDMIHASGLTCFDGETVFLRNIPKHLKERMRYLLRQYFLPIFDAPYDMVIYVTYTCPIMDVAAHTDTITGFVGHVKKICIFIITYTLKTCRNSSRIQVTETPCLNLLERGDQPLSEPVAMKMQTLFGFSAEWVLFGKGRPMIQFEGGKNE